MCVFMYVGVHNRRFLPIFVPKHIDILIYADAFTDTHTHTRAQSQASKNKGDITFADFSAVLDNKGSFHIYLICENKLQ
jgi:hypothetical protein